MSTRECGWEWPNSRPDGTYARCDAPGTYPIIYRVDGRIVWHCINHAWREVWGGQAKYVKEDK